MTQELLHLLWVVEATLNMETELNATLDAVVSGPLFEAAELPQPTESERRPPADDDEDDFQAALNLE